MPAAKVATDTVAKVRAEWKVLRASAIAVVCFLIGAGATACGDDTNDTSTMKAPTSSENVASTIPADEQVDLQFRAVLKDLPAGTSTVEGLEPDQVVLTDTDGQSLLLGPVLLEGAVFESAEAQPDPQGEYWQVVPVFRSGAQGIDGFNKVAEQCYSAAPTCPATAGGPGRIAMVLNGEVVTAAAINTPSFDRESIAIAGGFSEETARSIAKGLTGQAS